ncbi:MAG: right-handed parallel beta-helix repeat-containing protein [Rhodobacterales bacterium]|nr:right-handed parallel beta-helix repeat-containing protein [Rhodobacterales bacterium]
MNKVITDGLVLMPTPFSAGLNVWSSGDGTPGSDTYAGSGNGVFVPADQDFAGCLEITKTASTTKLRYMGETTVLPGCYLRVTARVKAVAGALPAVRIAGWAGGAGGAPVTGVTTTGPSRQLVTYGEVVEVSAIIGTGQRTGVNMVWSGVIYGHFGLDLTGPNGGVVRIDDIVIEDVTEVFHRNMMAMVDVRDYGAIGNGTANDAAAFLAADAAAAGREVLVSAGTYYLNADVTMQSRVRFEGKVTMPVGRRFILQKNFDYATYVDAFGNEELAFKKAFQALINFADHEGLDLGGRRISLSGPVDMQGCDPTRTSFATRRVIRNGQFQPIPGTAWNTAVVTSAGTYNPASPLELTAVTNIANVAVGSLVTGNGVGREVYVRAVNVAQQRITLSRELYDAAGTQTFTFRRFKYLLDFSGYEELSQFVLADIEFQCDGEASAVMLARQGLTFALRDCFITRPKDRGITSIGTGCQGMLIDRCQFQSNEQSANVLSRTTIGLNANANDVKIRDNRAVMFKHFAVLGGTGSLISGNHWFQGDTTSNGVRIGGLILTLPNQQSVITGNYIDNNFIEWTNEHDATPALGAQFSFGGLTITGNTCVVSNVGPWFNWLVIKPYGPGHFVHGLSVISNVFRTFGGNINRIEAVDTTFADLDYTKMRNVNFIGNAFNGVNQEVRNPLSFAHTQATASRFWVADPGTWLPFNGRARTVEAVVPAGQILNAGGQNIYEAPYVQTEFGASGRQVRAVFGTAVTGALRIVVRIDNPQ